MYQIDRQNEAPAISTFALPIDIAPHNRIGLGRNAVRSSGSKQARQAAQIQKVSAQVEVNKPTPRVVVNKP
jgi:hypothetical protein